MMICNNCGYEIKSGHVCPSCGADNVLLSKAKTASLRQYNKGVAFAKEGDYSAAIESLRECILFDKYNFVARNLLGIAYFQIGLVTYALKEWIISTSIKKEKNPAQKYIDALQKNARRLEKYNDAICMYNKAIKQFKLNNNDLAVISLKKAADINPNFVDAQNLLSAYYISCDDKIKAKKYIYRALKVDKRNPRALEYLAEITNHNEKEEEISKSKQNENESELYGYNEKIDKEYDISFCKRIKSVFKSQLFMFISGAVISAAVFATLALPDIVDVKNNQINSLNIRITELENENKNGTSTFAIKYKNLEEEVENLRKENEKYKGEYSIKQQQMDIESAKAYIENQKYSQAAEILLKIDETQFDDSTKSEIENLRNECYPYAADEYYTSGVEAMQKDDSKDAQNDFLLSVKLNPKSNNADNALYYLAEIEETNGNLEQAKSYYERIVNEFSNSDVFKDAEEKILEISKTLQQ
ncbi:MAG: tetratricopeptide repeat protein [Clostridia bacterium]|jgi:TolA-binding protein|nr:tetratricopeptide repeat protein [Clostridia bacterium]